MTFQLASLPRITSYAGAQRLFNDTKPLRGTADHRPLGRRSAYAPMQILKRGEDYILRLYSTDIVTYRPDGSVLLNTGRWPTNATARAMDDTSPLTVRRRGGVVVASCAAGDFWVADKLEIDPQGKPVDPPEAYATKQLVNKEKAKQVRKYFAAVPAYIQAFQAAFAGGQRPASCVDPYCVDPYCGDPLEDDAAVQLAWEYIQTTYDRATQAYVIINAGEKPGQLFWRGMYSKYGVRQTHRIALPYGQVP